jgi:hypothetical protein
MQRAKPDAEAERWRLYHASRVHMVTVRTATAAAAAAAAAAAQAATTAAAAAASTDAPDAREGTAFDAGTGLDARVVSGGTSNPQA